MGFGFITFRGPEEMSVPNSLAKYGRAGEVYYMSPKLF